MEDLRVRLFKFAALCCVATLLLAEGSVLQSGDQIVQCAETKVKGNYKGGFTSTTGSEVASL